MSDAEIAELLATNPNDHADAVCWSALGRVVDDDPTFVYGDGDESGMTVTCQVLTGPFQGVEVAAMVASPLGSGVKMSPMLPGTRLLLNFLDGDLDGLIVATASVPGGKETPFPKAAAGMKLDEEGLAEAEIDAPAKGVGKRFYIRGAAFLIRLKGAQDGFAGEFYLEADDAADSESGENGTYIRVVRDPSTGKFAIKLRDATGASFTLVDGAGILASPNQENTIQVDDDGVHVNAKLFEVNAPTCRLDGSIFLAYPPGVPPNPSLGGAVVAQVGGAVAGVAGISTKVFIGP